MITQVVIVFIVLLFIVLSLYFEWTGPSFTFLIGVSVLAISGILTPKEIMAGFANEQIAVILLLLLIGDVIRKSSAIEKFFDWVFRSCHSYKSFVFRMTLVVSTMSAFFNNTPLVAIMMPYVDSWSRRNNVSSSKLLIPLSYAAILGGCATLIGTSTNLIVNGLLSEQTILPGLAPLEMFDFSLVGVPMIVVGIIYLVFFSRRLLPDKKDAMADFNHSNRDYLLQAVVNEGSPLVGKRLEDDRLQNLRGLYMVEIVRGDKHLSAISPQTQIMTDDQLTFAGDTETIASLITQSDSGLTFPGAEGLLARKYTQVIEIVISHNSTLIGKTVLEANFRMKFDAAVIAVHRNGERITGQITYEKLKAGDALLLYAGQNFVRLSRNTQDFFLITQVIENRKISSFKSVIMFVGLIASILLSVFRIVPLFTSLLFLLVGMNIMGICSPKDIYKSLDLNLAMIISLALALGVAMTKTGVATMIAQSIITLFMPLGVLGLLFGIYLVTSLMANLITNKAAVALVFPIVLTISKNLHIPPEPLVLLVAFASAANFMTPIGYQTNLMVYGPGGYSFKDFTKIGFPLTFLYLIVTVIVLYFTYF
ncbi:SLC13 family permease [Halosquirtibacter xylanolyticus]|uniref:SLC13 family permease n=1 Tax=Halosquirtibacter xylanolyticus TaxID=3374599 RepID=UPI003748089B|nr:SLC13 family permease [Prolixibacteraceae bacterium]